MSDMLEYFATTHREKIEADWEKTKKYDGCKNSPTIAEFLEIHKK